MQDDRITVDLEDRIREIDEAMADIRSEAADPDVDRHSEKGQELAEEYEQLERAKQRLERDIERFGGSEWVIKRFRFGEVNQVNDMVLSDTIDDDQEDPRKKFSARKARTIQVGVVEAPPNAPADLEPRSLEPPTGEYLYQCIDNLNEYGEVTLSDFSLWNELDDES